MSKKLVSRVDLSKRWRAIEEDDEDDTDPSTQQSLNHLREQWFADAFNFLICLPKESHIWCGYWDIMAPLLETFYNYSKDERQESPLRLLWKRISKEMQHCIECVSKHHQAQEMYDTEYEFSSVGLLLGVLRNLDEERVTLHLQEINARLEREEYDPQHDNAEVISVMYEVLMFPILLDDRSLFVEFEKFIEAVDNMHELALGRHQQFPGVYALLFFNRRVRIIGYRLAKSMGKLRGATDLEPLQPLLKKFIGFLEAEGLPSTSEDLRPRAQLDRLSIWLGITSLLEFLEPPAFEDGILERYPIFFDMVLNHINGDSPEFSQAVGCLKELFQMLGYKLWLRSTLSPSVMRNTLLGQCFHTRMEKIHKVIFDLFQPFLQSLEALQDGEHEKQRRHFLYFLLHQVPVSSNFSVLTRNIGCKISLLIILRGYQMNPPCPPSECSHMWCPALISSLKDTSLHISLRQPAFDLMQTIMVSDATALITSMLNCSSTDVAKDKCMELEDDDENNMLQFSQDIKEKDTSTWSAFITQSKNTSRDCRGWMCIPMLWVDVLVEIDPLVLPLSFFKAVFWARSRFSLIEPENNAQMLVDIRAWLSSSTMEIAPSLGWKVPTGGDDGVGGKESKNSMEVSTMLLPLIRTFKRLTTHFLIRTGQGEVREHWSWEPRMGEVLILSLLDPNDNVRQLGKCILEEVSKTRGLACGLKFLCSYKTSLLAVFVGIRYALNQVQLDSVLLNFHTLHHFFFVLCKLLKAEDTPKPDVPKDTSEGGFLRQPVTSASPANSENSLPDGVILREEFCCLLSEVAWTPIKKCLIEGKAFINHKLCQMTCVRTLEIIPVILQRIQPPFAELSGDTKANPKYVFDFEWLNDLIDWGKSEQKVVIVYWKRALTSVLSLWKGSRPEAPSSLVAVRVIENLISCDIVDMDELTEQVSRLCVSLSKELLSDKRTTPPCRASSLERLPYEKKYTAPCMQPPPVEDMDVQILESVASVNKQETDTILLSDDEISDDEIDKQLPEIVTILSDSKSSHPKPDVKSVVSAHKIISHTDKIKKRTSSPDGSKYLLNVFEQDEIDKQIPEDVSVQSDIKVSLPKLISKAPLPAHKIISRSDSVKTKPSSSNTPKFLLNIFQQDSSGDASQKQGSDQQQANHSVSLKAKDVDLTKKERTRRDVDRSITSQYTNRGILKELVHGGEDDPLESAFKSARSQQAFFLKPGPLAVKRKVIQLSSPIDSKTGQLQRPGAGFKRFKQGNLEDWYRHILELDYFATVGQATTDEEVKAVEKLKKVPLCFQSHEQYINIFQPLVLEEFKAQLQSSYQSMTSIEEMYCGSISILSVERVDDFHLIRFVHDDSSNSRSFSENDLVLITKESPKTSTHAVHVIGKVERRERDDKRRSSILLIRFYLQNGSLRLNQARKNFLERSKWHASCILSITPQIREFQAISSMNDIPLYPVILNPVGNSVHYNNEEKKLNLSRLSQPLQQKLKSSYNDCQLQAISVAIGSCNSKRDFELSLIQGPPGTGKTRTILAIVSGLLSTFQHRSTESYSSMQSRSVSNNSKGSMNQSAAIARAWQDAALAKQLTADVETERKPTEYFTRGRVLICAQSNAAVDELVSRISTTGLYGRDGNMYKPYLVRVGNAKTVHPNSLPFFIDTLVDQRLAEERMRTSDGYTNLGLESLMTLRANLEKLVDQIRFYEAKRANIKDGGSDMNMLDDETHKRDDVMSDAELEVKLQKLYEQKKQNYKDLSAAQAQERKANVEIRALKHKFRKSVLREAHIVVTTLSGSGGDLYGVCTESISTNKFGSQCEDTLFDAVVIDEAAQALEPATLIPLQLLKSRRTRCIMVGDPKQLPATVLSNVASKFLFECSMFERLQKAGYPVLMLTQQYRMHPEICRFPSLHFYDNKLLNGETISSKSAPFHETRGLEPYVFYDVVDGLELRRKDSGALSIYNEQEAEAAVQLFKYFKKRYPSEFLARRIGILTPYKCQLSLLRSRFSNAFGAGAIANMEFNTVDGFQGREVDILLLSTVRAANLSSASRSINSSNIGFVADVRRMNVSLTRAKFSLWILGNARTLVTNQNWAALLKDAEERNVVITTKNPYESTFYNTELSREKFVQRSMHPNNVQEYNRKLAKQHETGSNSSFATKAINRLVPSVGTAGRHGINSSVNRVDAHSNERKTNDRHSLPVKKGFPPIAVDSKSETSKGATSTVIVDDQKQAKRRREESNKRKQDLETPHIRKEKHSEQLHSHKLTEFKVPKKSSSPDKTRRDSEAANSSRGRGQTDSKVNNDSSSNIVGGSEDLIAKRKQQREAVDAILCSSLISSKQSAQTSKSLPPKRSRSPPSRSHGIRPAKARKDSTNMRK